MSSVGPDGLGTCTVQEILSRTAKKGAIYYSETGVDAVGFQFESGEAVWIGNRTGTSILVDLSPTEVFIGFHGISGTNSIDAVGFLTHDPACSALPEPAIDNGGRNGVQEGEGDDQTTLIAILASCGALLLIVLAICIYICCKKRCNKSTTKVQVFNDGNETGSQRQESHVELRGARGDLTVPSLPNIDTDEEHNSQMNMATNRITPSDTQKSASPLRSAKKLSGSSNDITR